jgi:ABC-type multidrug transport system fused ATPase/permease subunit
MYESGDLGLEADVSRIIKILEDVGYSRDQSENVIEVLKYSRIARVGGYNSKKFSFVHRRFAEFFVVDQFKKEKIVFGLEDIPTDSRWRDCLVMYCGIAEFETKKEIANYCWAEIESVIPNIVDGRLDKARNAVHCLRFLTDAFRSDVDALSDFSDEIGAVVIRFLESSDPLVAKIGSEGIPLLGEKEQQRAILKAFEQGSRWVCDSTLRACRHLGELKEDTFMAVRGYLGTLPCDILFSQFFDINFSLSLSDSFRKQRYALWADVIEILILIVVVVGLLGAATVYMPSYSMLVILLYMISLATAFILHDYSSPILKKAMFVGMEVEESIFYRKVLSKAHSVFSALAGRDVLIGSIRIFLIINAYCVLLNQSKSESAGPIELFGNDLGSISVFVNETSLASLPFVGEVYEVFAKYWEAVFDIPTMNVDFPSWIYIIFVLLVAGWEKTYKLVKNILGMSFQMVFRVMSIIVLSGVLVLGGFALSWGLTILWSYIPQDYKLYILWVIAIITCLLFISFGIGAIALTGRAIVDSVYQYWEMRRMIRVGLPETATCTLIYDTCLSFKSSRVRRTYLERIRLHQIPLMKEYVAPPIELVNNNVTAEELAKLREQWYELSS